MTAVLTAFRSNEEKVAAAVAECRRMGIEVLPPDVHTSHLEFTVEGDAIRFGLLAVKNVGQGAIESIIAARDEGGAVPLADRLLHADRPAAGQPQGARGAGQGRGARARSAIRPRSCSGSTTRSAAAQATQRDRITGQTSLFDLGAADAAAFERPLPTATEVPVRERLRWEKELLGLYLSEHPMGEVAEQVGRFVTAYSGDLRDESLDGQRVVVGGIVTGVRTVITKAKATMAIVTLEDLQGTIEVVVFPRLYETDDGHVARRRDPAGRRPGRPQERGGLAAGRPRGRVGRGGGRRRGELRAAGGGRRSWWWRTAAERAEWHTRGPDPFRRRVGRSCRSVPASRSGWPQVEAAAVPRGCRARRPGVPFVSPRGQAPPRWRAPRSRRPSRRSHRPNPSRPTRTRRASHRVPTRTTSRRSRTRRAPGSWPTPPPTRRSTPVRRPILHVRFAGSAAPDRVVGAMETFKAVLRDRPGGTRVVIHVPSAAGGAALPMELRRGVAYDAELLAEVRRRLGDGLVDLRLA